MKRGRFVEGQHRRIRVQNLFQQRRAAARMPAEKSDLIIFARRGRFLSPTADHFWRQPCQHFAPPPVAFIISLLQLRRVSDSAHLCLGLEEPADGFIVLAELIQYHTEQMRCGVFHIGILRIIADQIAQGGFRLGIFLFAMQQQSTKTPRLIVARMLGKNGFDAIPSLVQSAFLLEPHGQTNPRIHGIRIGRHGSFVTASRRVELPQSLILHSDHAQQTGVRSG